MSSNFKTKKLPPDDDYIRYVKYLTRNLYIDESLGNYMIAMYHSTGKISEYNCLSSSKSLSFREFKNGDFNLKPTEEEPKKNKSNKTKSQEAEKKRNLLLLLKEI